MPIRENINVPKEEGKTFEVLPADVYQVELVDVNIEEVPNYDDKSKLDKTLSFLFAINEEGEYKGRWLTYRYVPLSLYIGSKGKNKLYNVIETLLGREMTMEEEATMDTQYIGGLIGNQIRLVVKIKEKGDKKSNIIESLLVVKSNLAPFTREEVSKMQADYQEAQKKWNEKTTEMPEKFATEHQGDNMDDSIPTIQLEDEEIRIEDVPFN